MEGCSFQKSKATRAAERPRAEAKKSRNQGQGEGDGKMGGKPGLKAGNGQAAEWRREEGAFIPSDESKGWKGSMSE